jgi:hypothetical protein
MRPCALAALALLGGAACNTSNGDPASYVTGLRVLAIKAEPPEVPVGATATLTALAIDTDGAPIEIAWAQCLATALQAYAINPDCITTRVADYLQPVGNGLSVMITMPAVDPAVLGRADASGGVYLPLIAQAAAASDSLTASYRLRVGLGLPANQNPMLAGIFVVTTAADGSIVDLVPLDEASPLVVHAGAQITLRATFVPGSAETYDVYDGDPATTPPRTFTETLSASWFATAGNLAAATTGADVPDQIVHFDETAGGPALHLPPSGTPIDLWVVGRDERGGTDYLHRRLQFE